MLPDSTLRARISTRAGRSLAAAIDDIAALRSTIADGSHPRVAKRVDLKRKAFAKHAAWKQLPPPDYHNVMPYVAAIDPHAVVYLRDQIVATQQRTETLLILLRPHSAAEIYPCIGSMVTNKFLSHPRYRARLLRNHLPALMHFEGFHDCDFTVATNIFRQCLSFNSTDGVAVAGKIMYQHPGMFSTSHTVHTRPGPHPELEDDPPAPADDPNPSTPRRGRFSVDDFIRLLHVTATVDPAAILHSLRAFGFDAPRTDHLVEQPRAIAHAVADKLLEYDYESMELARGHFACISAVYHMDVPLQILRRLNEKQDHPGYVNAVETVMHHFHDHYLFYQNPVVTDDLPDALALYRVCYGPDNAAIDDPRRIARLIAHPLPYHRLDRWSSPLLRPIVGKIDWAGVLGDPGAFNRLIYGAADTWSGLVVWSMGQDPAFSRQDTCGRMIETLWRFTMAHDFYSDPTGLFVHRHDVDAVARVSTHITSMANVPVNGFDALKNVCPVNDDRRVLHLDLMHIYAGRIFAPRTPTGGRALAALYVDETHEDPVAQFFYRCVSETVWGVARAFRKVPGVVRIPDANFEYVLDDGGAVDHADLCARFQREFPFSLHELLNPRDLATFIHPANQHLRAWIGFMVHPLFARLLPRPPRHGIHRFRFVDADGSPRPYPTRYVQTFHQGPRYYWPADRNMALRVSMQVYDNTRRAIAHSPITRAEWLQVRAIVGAANLRRGRDAPQDINPTVVQDASDEIDKLPGTVITTTPPRVVKPGSVFDLSALEPELLHRIYTHLVRLQVNERPLHLCCVQTTLHLTWFTGSIIPIRQLGADGPFVCPTAVPNLTDDRGVLQDRCVDAVNAVRHLLLRPPCVRQAFFDDSRYSIRITLLPDYTLSLALQPNPAAHTLHRGLTA